MITEDYVSFETAKLLKEKGFMEGAIIKFFASGYDSKGNILDIRDTELKDYPRPTIQMAMKWLREVHNIMISIRLFNSSEPFWGDEPHQFAVDIATKSLPSKAGHLRGIYSTYEGACEAAIKYCLENLI